MKKILTAACTSLVLVAASTSAFAADKCSAGPQSEWKPQAELEKTLVAKGWKIKRVKIDAGCYEVYGTDGAGKRAETYFHPKTLAPVNG